MLSSSLKIGLALFLASTLSAHSFAAETSPPNAIILDRLEAAVNASTILLSDIAQFRRTLPLRAQLDPLFAGTPLSAKGSSATDSEITQFLIDERLVLDQFPIKDADVEQEINSIQANNRIDRKTLKAALREQGYDFDEYFQLIRIGAAKKKLIESDIRTKVFVSDDDIKNYFYNHLEGSGNASFSYRIRIITLSPQNYKSKGAAYQAAQDAIKSIRGGESFEEVAKRVSDDPSAASGGDLGMLPEDEISTPIRNAVKRLKVGEVSGILGTENSRYFILKLVDIQSGQEDRLAKTRDEIRARLATAEYQNQISLWLKRQRQLTYIHLAGDPSIPGQHASK